MLDEPTSGMDSQTAWAVCLLLRKLCNDGKTILVTIHQPSAKLFSIFDNVLLLGEEGRLLYFGGIGNESSKLIEYFERNGAPRCESGQNPAEWVFDVTKGSDQADSPENTSRKDWYDTWSKSEERAKVLSHIHELKEDVVVETDEDASTTGVEYAATFVRQLSMVVKRVFQQYWRDPTYLLSKAALCAGVVSPAHGRRSAICLLKPDTLQRSLIPQHYTKLAGDLQYFLLGISVHTAVQHFGSANHSSPHIGKNSVRGS